MKLNFLPSKKVGMLTEWVNILGGSWARLNRFMAGDILTQITTKATSISSNYLFCGGVTGLNQKEKVFGKKQYLLLDQQKQLQKIHTPLG